MYIFFEIPILLIVFLVLGILGVELGPILCAGGLLGLVLGFPFVLFADDNQRTASGCLFILPNVLIIVMGLCIGDHSLYDLLF